MKYVYKMEQLPPNIQIDAARETGTEAAQYLQRIVNEKSSDGWEFFRVDTISVTSKPGCLDGLLHTFTAGILGKKEQIANYYVVTFRKDA
jgi:hypothetical protein